MVSLLRDISGLIYPRLCVACSREHPQSGGHLCVSCHLVLPRTDYHLHRENGMMRRLEGRVPLEAAAAMYHFLKESPLQMLLHRIKYQGQYQAAYGLGLDFGRDLAESEHFRSVDYIVPVPLHAERLHMRGYNQSEWLARGIAEAMQKPLSTQNLWRIRSTRSQTKMGRQQRMANLEGAFQVKNSTPWHHKHLLLVDDVFTTGATMESCAIPLLDIPGVRLSLATLAIAQN
jgi:ComF family protein